MILEAKITHFSYWQSVLNYFCYYFFLVNFVT